MFPVLVRTYWNEMEGLLVSYSNIYKFEGILGVVMTLPYWEIPTPNTRSQFISVELESESDSTQCKHFCKVSYSQFSLGLELVSMKSH